MIVLVGGGGGGGLAAVGGGAATVEAVVVVETPALASSPLMATMVPGDSRGVAGARDTPPLLVIVKLPDCSWFKYWMGIITTELDLLDAKSVVPLLLLLLFNILLPDTGIKTHCCCCLFTWLLGAIVMGLILMCCVLRGAMCLLVVLVAMPDELIRPGLTSLTTLEDPMLTLDEVTLTLEVLVRAAVAAASTAGLAADILIID